MREFTVAIQPDYEGLLKTVRREGTPKRVHHIELFLDAEVKKAIVDGFGLGRSLSKTDPRYGEKLEIELSRFLGYDYVHVGLDAGLIIPVNTVTQTDSAELAKDGGRTWVPEGKGAIQSWEDFEKFPWPDPDKLTARSLEWYNANLPDDMTIIAGHSIAHYAEYLCWLFGYESLCYALFEQRDLVLAVKAKLEDLYEKAIALMLQFDRVTMIWGSDDMGFKNGLLIGPEETRQLVLPGHKRMAEICHANGRPYLLHSCGALAEIMDDLINDVRLDAKHSFEDVIQDVCSAKRQYGDRLTLLGGIDVDFLCRFDEKAVRERVRKTIDVCQPGGGWCLGTGNSVANYIPIDNYLTMLDEGRRYGR